MTIAPWYTIARMTKFILLSAALVLSPALFADELHEEMEAVGKAVGVLRKAVPAKSMADVSTAAQQIADLLPKSLPVWEKRGFADATKWTKESIDLAKELKMAADAGHAEHVSMVFGKLGGLCKTCHEAHREKLPDGKYKIK